MISEIRYPGSEGQRLAGASAVGESNPSGFSPLQPSRYLGFSAEGWRQGTSSSMLGPAPFVADAEFPPVQDTDFGRKHDEPQFSIVLLQNAAAARTRRTEVPAQRVRIAGPVRFIVKLIATWDLKPEVASACTLLGFEPSEAPHVRDVLQGLDTLRGRDVKDRIAHLFRIRTLLSSLFRDDAVEREWLREPRDLLKGKAPMDLLMEGSMENLLLVRELVEVASGR